MLDLDPTILFGGVTVLVSTGAAWGATHFTSTANKEKLSSLRADLNEHVKVDVDLHTAIIDRLARIETKLDAVYKQGQ